MIRIEQKRSGPDSLRRGTAAKEKAGTRGGAESEAQSFYAAQEAAAQASQAYQARRRAKQS